MKNAPAKELYFSMIFLHRASKILCVIRINEMIPNNPQVRKRVSKLLDIVFQPFTSFKPIRPRKRLMMVIKNTTLRGLIPVKLETQFMTGSETRKIRKNTILTKEKMKDQ